MITNDLSTKMITRWLPLALIINIKIIGDLTECLLVFSGPEVSLQANV